MKLLLFYLLSITSLSAQCQQSCEKNCTTQCSAQCKSFNDCQQACAKIAGCTCDNMSCSSCQASCESSCTTQCGGVEKSAAPPNCKTPCCQSNDQCLKSKSIPECNKEYNNCTKNI